MTARADRVRRFQVAFLVLLLVAFGQVVWWLIDQASFIRESHGELQAALERERDYLQEALLGGARPVDMKAEHPDLEVLDGRVRVRAESLEALAGVRRHRLNRYLWEGGFFLAVLGAGMAILWRALSQEAELHRRQENFLAAVSHELKSPLASLRLAIETLRARELDVGQRKSWLERSLGDVDRLESLVSNLLDSSRLESKGIQLVRESVELDQIVRSVVSGLETSDQPIRNDVPPGLGMLVDPIAASTVVRNLLENALKATAPAGSVHIAARSEDEVVVLTVVDDGVGFDPAEAGRLFEKFYRPGDELRRRNRGTGLGLYLVKRFVELEGGTVEAFSDGPERGARFVVRWPRSPLVGE